MNKNRILTVILIISAMLTSCGDKNTLPSGNVDVQGIDSDTDGLVTTIEDGDGLPDKKLDGFQLRFYNYNSEYFVWAENQLDAESESGDTLNDTIYKRNRNIEDRFDAKIIETTVRDTKSDIVNIILSGEDLYDVVMMYDLHTAELYANDMILSWNDVPYISFEKAYWNPGANSVFSINGEQFASVGDFSMSMRSRNYFLIMNKDI